MSVSRNDLMNFMKSDTYNIYSQYFKEIARKVLFIARILSYKNKFLNKQ